MTFKLWFVSPVHVTDCETVCGDDDFYISASFSVLSTEPWIAGSLGNRILSSQRLLKASGPKEKQDTGEEGKKPSFQQFSTVLGCKPSPATGLGVGIEMMHSKGLLHPKEIFASSARVLAQSFLGKQLPEAGRRVHAEVSL